MADDTTAAPDAPESAPEADSLRGDLERAFDQVEVREAPPGATPPPPATPAADTAAVPPGERARDASGRFVPKEGGSPDEPPPPKPKPAAPAPVPAPGPKPAPGTPAAAAPAEKPAAQLRAPVSWKPNIREHWTKLPPEVQAEVHRREQDIGHALQESASAREALQYVQQVIGPYANNIRASGSDALGAIANFFQADHTLRHGSMPEKAQLVASIIKQYGVDIQALDSTLAGQPAQDSTQTALLQQVEQRVNAQLQPLVGFFNQMQGQRAQAFGQIEQEAGAEVASFGQDAAHEFFNDVREEMADIIEMYTKRGQVISLQEAYDRATKLNPHVSDIVMKRAAQEQASAQAQAAQRAKRTAASIASSPAPAGTPGPTSGTSLRSDIESAFSQHEGG